MDRASAVVAQTERGPSGHGVRSSFRGLFGASAVALVSRIVTAACNFAMGSLMLRHLATAQYGRLTVALSFLALIPFADLGIGSAVVSRLAALEAHGDLEGFRATAMAARTMLRRIAAVVTALGLVGLAVVPAVHINVTDPAAVAALLIVMGATLSFAVYQRILLGLQRMHLVNAAQVMSSSVALGVTALVVTRHPPLWLLALTWYLQLVLVPMISRAIVGRHFRDRMPAGSTAPRLGPLVRLGLGFLALTAVAALSFETDALIIAAIKGPASVTIYDVHGRMFGFIYSAAVFAVIPVWPGVAAAMARRDTDWIARVARWTVGLTACGSAVAGGVCLGALPAFTHLFSGGKVQADWLLGGAFLAWTVCQALGSATSMILNGMGTIWPQVVLGGVGLVGNILLGVLLTPHIGASGPVFGTVFAEGMFSVVALCMIRSRLHLVQTGTSSA